MVGVEPLVERDPLVGDRQDDPRLFSGVGQVEIDPELGLRHPAVPVAVGRGVKEILDQGRSRHSSTLATFQAEASVATLAINPTTAIRSTWL